MKIARKSAGILVALWVGLFACGPVAAQESVCARVKIEIKQELTLERQAFDAEMRITNSLPATPLTEVFVDVMVTDEMGTPVAVTTDPNDLNAKFFLRQTQKQNIDNTTGTGQVAANTTATINWMLIPGRDAADNRPFGKRYLVGATLRYRFGTETHVMELNPDAITVKPLPSLTLDYFLTRDVIADDPFTTEIEAPEPYTLGVRVKNSGLAAAKDLKIASAQPRIVENLQGLPITFQIIGSYVQDLPTSNSLLINFGDIASSTSKMGRWQMESNIAGKFVDFTATFTHSDELGGALTSLLQATNAHLLLRDVRVDLPGRDMVRDFLAIDGTDLNVYESEGNQDNVVTDRSAEASLTTAGGNYRLSMPAAGGFMYVRKPDPFNGQKVLGPVMRADAKAMATENVWLSKVKNSETKQWEYWFNVFDVNSPGVYDVAFRDPASAPKPPVLQFIPDRVVKEKEQLGFLVEASSNPVGKPVTLMAEPLPTGATFHDQGDGTGVFDWTPEEGQAGEYIVNYLASDGTLSATRSAKIRVESAVPPPGPAIPQLFAPLAEAEIQSLHPQLQVLTGEASNDPTQSVQFELYADAGMTIKVGEAIIPKNQTLAQPTTWSLVDDLNDNTHYYWRARALAANSINSEWVNGSFFTNLANDPPESFNLTSPATAVEVDSLTPTLSLTNAQDRDGDAMTYSFEVFTDIALTQRHDGVAGLAPDASGTTSWTIAIPLTNHATYHWRAVATDEHGAETKTPTRPFTVFTGNIAPTAPVAISPINGVDVTTAGTATLAAQNSSDAENDPLSYVFEIDTVNTFDSSSRLTSDPVPAGAGTTSWTVSTLIENQRYFWRVKALDGRAESEWTTGEFLMDAANEAPSVPSVSNPGDSSWVGTLYPNFEVHPSTDPENDPLRYRFEVYRDSTLQTLVASGTGDAIWQATTALLDKTTHYWRVRAEDNVGAVSSWSPAMTLFVSTGSYVAPSIALTSPATIVDARDGVPDISWDGTDPNIEPTIALYYDTAGSGFAGTKIVDGLRQDAGTHSGSYAWNVSALAPGAYNVYGVIYDNKGLGRAYAPGAVVVPTSPQQGGVTATAPGGLNLREGRDSGNILVSLSRLPKAPVVVPLASSDSTEAYVVPNQLVFTSANWSTPQSATVIAVADGVKDDDQPFSVSIGKVVSRDPDYIGLSATTITGVVLDQNADANTGLSIASYQLISKQLDRKTGQWEYQYKAVLTNNGARVKGVMAEIASAPGFEVVQGRLRYGAVDQDESVISNKEIVLLSQTDIGGEQPVIYWTLVVQ